MLPAARPPRRTPAALAARTSYRRGRQRIAQTLASPTDRSGERRRTAQTPPLSLFITKDVSARPFLRGKLSFSRGHMPRPDIVAMRRGRTAGSPAPRPRGVTRRPGRGRAARDRAGGAGGEQYTVTASRSKADLTSVIVAITGRAYGLTRQKEEHGRQRRGAIADAEEVEAGCIRRAVHRAGHGSHGRARHRQPRRARQDDA